MTLAPVNYRIYEAVDRQAKKSAAFPINVRIKRRISPHSWVALRSPGKGGISEIKKSQFGLVSRPKTSMISATVAEKPSVAWPAAKVEIWPIERLTANPRNARIHGVEQIGQIRASLREFGWTMPVLVRENGMLIAGHGRLEAARL
jgi:hypothetical protein